MKDIGVHMLPAADGRGKGISVKKGVRLHFEKGIPAIYEIYRCLLQFLYVNWIRERVNQNVINILFSVEFAVALPLMMKSWCTVAWTCFMVHVEVCLV